MANPLAEARKRQLARLDGAKPLTGSMALLPSRSARTGYERDL
jgi:hypothetical protein